MKYIVVRLKKIKSRESPVNCATSTRLAENIFLFIFLQLYKFYEFEEISS
jgi:hypothetical protein